MSAHSASSPNIAKSGSGSRADRRPLYQKTAEALRLLLGELQEGAFLPSEPALARQFGVSRATLREAMRGFEEQGLIVRRQGVGTYVARPMPIMETGLEVLESIETLAARIGLEVYPGPLRVETRPMDETETCLRGAEGDGQVVEITRVMYAGGRPIAHLVDILPVDVLPPDALGSGFGGSVLDLLLRRGIVGMGSSRTEIKAVAADAQLARELRIQRGDVLMRLEACLYTAAGRPIDHSYSNFLPGTFRFHVVRRVGSLGALPRR
jgi:GntR family transcriptional regulator